MWQLYGSVGAVAAIFKMADMNFACYALIVLETIWLHGPRDLIFFGTAHAVTLVMSRGVDGDRKETFFKVNFQKIFAKMRLPFFISYISNTSYTLMISRSQFARLSLDNDLIC